MSTILSSLARQPTEKQVTKPKDYKKIKEGKPFLEESHL